MCLIVTSFFKDRFDIYDDIVTTFMRIKCTTLLKITRTIACTPSDNLYLKQQTCTIQHGGDCIDLLGLSGSDSHHVYNIFERKFIYSQELF